MGKRAQRYEKNEEWKMKNEDFFALSVKICTFVRQNDAYNQEWRIRNEEFAHETDDTSYFNISRFPIVNCQLHPCFGTELQGAVHALEACGGDSQIGFYAIGGSDGSGGSIQGKRG